MMMIILCLFASILHCTSFRPHALAKEFPQIQMQAGITGTNTIRIYNPTKQAQEHERIREFIANNNEQLYNTYTFEFSDVVDSTAFSLHWK
jgi:hypothetical protein